MLSRFCTLALLTAALGAHAADTSTDEARIDALVSKINEANKATQVPSLFGDEPGTLVADAPAAASSGTDSIAVPLDEEPTEADPQAGGTEGEPVDGDVAAAEAPTEAAEPTPAPTDEIVKGPVTYDQLSKLLGRRIRIMTMSGRRYEGELTTVTDSEARVSVRMYGTGVTVMPIKKAHVKAIELL